MNKRGWIDVSIPLRTGMVHWPGDGEVSIVKEHSMAKGDRNNLTHLDFGAHTGTHIDAPLHFIQDGVGIDTMPIEAMMGPARIIGIDDPHSVEPEALEQHEIREGDRVLLKTRNSDRCWSTDDFLTDYVYISEAAARYLVEKKVRTLGIDYLSVEKYNGGGNTHRLLLGAGVWLVEGLNLKDVPEGECEMICMPLRLVDTDGSPCRAFIRPI